MGSKQTAKRLMAEAGVPVVPGYHGSDQTPARLEQEAAATGFPLLVKAAAGGGGKGMRVVRDASEFSIALEAARREAESAFGDGTVILERYVERPRHVEFQIFGDRHGGLVQLGERDCSTQRRYQKVIEEAPSPYIDDEVRGAMASAALAAARSVGYVGAGTVEFIVDPGRRFYFMEMNTRLQVEHPVTEMVTGLDLVRWQFEVAAGGRLPAQDALPAMQGHAVEARIYAEDPFRGFLPSTGRIDLFETPAAGADLRVDSGFETGDETGMHYDAMLAKLIAHGRDRGEAVARLRAALARTALLGPRTNLPLLQALCDLPAFLEGTVDTGFLDRELDGLMADLPPPDPGTLAAGSAALLDSGRCVRPDDPYSPWSAVDGFGNSRATAVTQRLEAPDGRAVEVTLAGGGKSGIIRVDGRDRKGELLSTAPEQVTLSVGGGDQTYATAVAGHQVFVSDGARGTVLRRLPRYADDRSHAEEDTHPGAPMPGTVVRLHVGPGDRVGEGDALLVLEGMKMEYTLRAPFAGTVGHLHCAVGDSVDADVPLVDLEREARA
jgi:3-methylcrotonyl-CoA carboxylase alpha subunit